MSEVMAGPTEHLVARSDYETLRDERDLLKEAMEEIRKVYQEYPNEYAYSIAQAALTPAGGQEHD